MVLKMNCSLIYLVELLILEKFSALSSKNYCHTQIRFRESRLMVAAIKEWRMVAQACGVPVGQCSGGRLATTLVATINNIIFFLSFYFLRCLLSHRSARIKKLV